MYYKFFYLKQERGEDLDILLSCPPQYSHAFKKYLLEHQNEFPLLFSYLNQALTFNANTYCQNLIVTETQTKLTKEATRFIIEILNNLLLVARVPLDNELESANLSRQIDARKEQPNFIGFQAPHPLPKIIITEINWQDIIYHLRNRLQNSLIYTTEEETKMILQELDKIENTKKPRKRRKKEKNNEKEKNKIIEQ